MKIVMDARWIFHEISGIGNYTRELLRNFARIDSDNEYLLLFQHADLRDRTFDECGLHDFPNFSAHLVPYGIFSVRNQCALPLLLRKQRADIYHTTNYMMPLLAFSRHGRHRTQCVTTIHDVIPLVFPDAAPNSRKARVFRLFRLLMRDIGARADAILTVSNRSAADIITHLKIKNASRVHVIPNGVSENFRPAGGQTYRKDGARSLLYVGRSDPYKNLVMLMRAFARACEKSACPLTLTIAGAPDPRYPEPQQTAEALGVADKVSWTGYISDEALLRLYRESDLLVHPSRYEGFGLQILEAMACGLPVLCSNGGSLPEVAGDAAVVLDANDETGFADSICGILNDPARLADLQARGPARAAMFTWEKTARQTLDIYTKLTAAHA